MKPKKEDNLKYILYALLLMVALYFAFHWAYCKAYVDVLVSDGTVASKDETSVMFRLLYQILMKAPFAFVWTKYTSNYLLYGGIVWIIVVAAMENSRRNYIHGKEYGTARWGKPSDIRMLFADNIAKKEINELKKRKSLIQRYFLKSKIINHWKSEGKKMTKLLKIDAEIQSFKLKDDAAQGVDISNYPKPKSEEEIKAEVASIVDSNIKREWKPVLYEEEYKQRVEDINSSPLYEDGERKRQVELAKKEYSNKCQNFYNDKNEALRIKAKYYNMDMLLTQTERISFINYQAINMNTLIIGGSGTGKTRNYVIPNLLQAHSSYVFTDPKGEICEKGGYYLEHEKGYKVRALDLVEKEKSACFNPIIYLHPERPGYEERVIALVETIMINTDGGEKKDTPDPFWPKAERMFLQALIYAIPIAFVEKYQTFQTLLDLISMLEIKDSSKEDYNSDLDIFFRKYKEKTGKEDFAYKTYTEFRIKAPDKTGNSVLMSILARMQPFRGAEIQRILSADDMHLDRIGEEKTAIFIIVPPTDQTFSFISGMLFTTLFQEIQYCATVVHRHEGQRLPVPVRLILDEFANTCTIPNFVQLLAYARSFGIGMTIILQSLEQIKKIYEKEYGVIIDNCSSMLYLGGIKHIETLNYFRDLLGKGTFDKKTSGRTRGRQGSSSINEDVVGRGLLESDELYAEMKTDECILFVTGRRPFYSKKYKYEEHPNYRFTSDADKKYSYEHHSIAHEVPHREDEHKIDEGYRQDFSDLKVREEEIKKDIEFNIDQQAAVRRLAKNLSEYDVIPDDELVVDDGETSESDINDSFEKILLEESESDVILDMTIDEIEEESESPSGTETREINFIKSLSFIIRDIKDFDFISDDELVVDDGETSESDINEAYEDTLSNEAEDDFTMDDNDKSDMETLFQELEENLDMKNVDEQIQSNEETIDEETD